MRFISKLFLFMLFIASGCQEYFVINSGSIATGPSAPTLVLDFPSASPGIFSKPTFNIQGLNAGDTVNLYSDSTCSTLVATGVSSGTDLDLRSSALAGGTFNFAAKRTNSEGTSGCSASPVTYVHNACPTGYIPVLADAIVGTTSDFCVMKFEAKDDSVSGFPISDAVSPPWVFITSAQAKTLCTDPGLGAGYDLISNPEWMTIARHLEANEDNWTGGAVGSGRLYQGHSDNAPGGNLSTTDESDPYDGTGDSALDGVGSGTEQKRTLEFTWGDTIWDFSGNNAEWIDWVLGGAHDYGPTTCFPGAWQTRQFPVVACGALTAADFMPANPAGVTPADYDSDYGLGLLQFLAGATGSISRGGAMNWSTSGIYFMAFDTPAASWPGTSFRCVYRP